MTGFSFWGMAFGFVTALCSSFFLAKKFFAVFQQTSYRGREYVRKLIICVPGRIIVLLCVGLLYGASVYFAEGKTAVTYVPLLSFVLLSACYGVIDKPVVKTAFTARMKRIFVTGTLLFVFSGAILGGFVFSPVVGFLLVSLTPAVPLSGALPWFGYDRAKYRQAKEKCKQRLAEYPELIRVGITGSCGKTSVKNYLNKMLSGSFDVLTTPKSFNTPLGICRATEKLCGDTEVFLVEMGARKRGDIAELCDMVSPSVAVLTSVTGQHLETFGSAEEIARTKYELVRAVGEKGFAVFSADSPMLAPLYASAPCEKISVGFGGEREGVKAENFRQGERGSSFDLWMEGKMYPIENSLVGKFSATDICLAAAVARKLGVPREKIASAACRLKAVEHRLSVSVTPGGVTIADDGYNANPEGIVAAAEFLDTFSGKKIVVTPGLAELGRFRRVCNENAGRVLAAHADTIVAIGKNGGPIVRGAGGRCETVRVRSREKAKKFLEGKTGRGDVVLFLNDFPDVF